MIRCLIIDDEPYARQLLAEYIEKVPFLELAGAYSNGLEALAVINDKHIDLLFLDIQMPEINGIEFLKALTVKPVVIFTTAYAEFALEGYELDVIDYLLKPFDFARFLKAAEKVRSLNITPHKNEENVSQTSKNYFFIKESNQHIKLAFDDILYIQGLKDYVKIKTLSGQHIVLQTMKALMEKLPQYQFVRIHNSYIISLDHIESMVQNKIKIYDKLLPVSSSYKKDLLARIEKLGI